MNFLKKIFIILIIIFISITFISCLSVSRKLSELAKESGADTSEYDKTLDELEKSLEDLTDSLEIGKIKEDTEEETTKEITPDFYVGENLIAENFCELNIHNVENYEAKIEYMQAEEGFRLIAVDVEIKNISNELQKYHLYNYEAQDSDRYVYKNGSHEDKEPYFGYGKLAPNQVRRGWVTIPVKKDAEIVAIIAQPFGYKSTPITIKLYTPLKP